MSDCSELRLAAIMMADVAGYTTMIENDSATTVEAWKAACERVLYPVIEFHSGKIVKLTGDGFLAEFASLKRAAECALELQARLGDSILTFRIAVHLGDIYDDGQDIHGEGVNIAARIESLVESGEIGVSGAVRDQVVNSIAADFEYIGEHVLKHVSAPVRVYKLTPSIKSSSTTIDSLAASQSIRYCQSADGTSIAYSILGEGPPVVLVSNWLSHLEHDLSLPSRRALLEVLAGEYSIVRFDVRGSGLSDREIADMSFERSVEDLLAVVDALDLEQFSVVALSQGAATAAVFAARQPDRVTKLVLYGGYARGRRRRGTEGDIAESDAFITMIKQGWGKEIDAYIQMFGTFFMPDASPDQLAGFTRFQRIAATPESAARIQLATDEIDVEDELPGVVAPTLVLHVREDGRSPFEEGRKMAAAIPGARFVPLEGRNHALLKGEPAMEKFLQEVARFLSD